ncbi:MAG: hypothetical protein A3C50_00320 [Candidatus Staskawiczbacteria bacterium RIFCSPHIGHO2_02_FULL_43_16]|uniref:Uncharacterized protein n=1 Tax=Candidatus Staskawiczbacteria bacterium RIFCSPHIGHO2_01_FULL_41_41 TaxID=1802203 RepID=A0A1G2HVJ9_9BACT|nr:MAG: hypothetical protein A2822_01985 [Candidatus Staskawiczbacteria bacterium RIFCSPHIGHO2_01_FULL_41_41]OGZ68930.1 MAG: hypothetical protein A3C50_00320 [Candidatus Staskawiczbacteria bacterium RIFCSPHIGHO2_02_FULL_43_16]OGZ74888.1 MAG: hypothetical protein A3A12_03495 [Candidatus Staskawiczbacteria bacterium RIFCSPLOWO2_01_FULL_43_17b]
MEPQGKILFKRTDIVTMRKDIKMLREFDTQKEAEKIVTPASANPAEAMEIEKQRAFTLKTEKEQVEATLKQLEASKESVLTKEKEQPAAVSKNVQLDEMEKRRWAAERSALEAKKRANEVEAKNKEAERQKIQLQEKIAQTNDALQAASAAINKQKNQPAQPVQPASSPAPVGENERRKKFMEDIEAWANSADKKS